MQITVTWFNNTAVSCCPEQSSLCESGLSFVSQFHSLDTSRFRWLSFLISRSSSRQESLWKRNQSARICRSVALKVNRDEFLASELKRRQSKVASFLARAVNEFWRTAEKMAIKDNARSLPNGKLFTEGTLCDKNDSEAVPMDVDILVMKEVHYCLIGRAPD